MSDYIIYPILVFIVFLFKSLGIGLAIVILLYIFASKSVKDKYLNTQRIDRMRDKTTNKIKEMKDSVVKEQEKTDNQEYNHREEDY